MADLVVENIITSVQLHQTMQLTSIEETLSEATFQEGEDSILVFSFSNPNHVILLTKTGSLFCTGTKDEQVAESSMQSVLSKLKEHDFIRSIDYSIEIVTLTVSCTLPTSIDLIRLTESLPDTTLQHSQESVSWVEYNVEETLVMLFFSTGKVICNGSTTVKDLECLFESMVEKLSELGIIKESMEEKYA